MLDLNDHEAIWREHVAAQASPRLFLFIGRQQLLADGVTPLTTTWLDGEGQEHRLVR